jgi:hypothetical protein
MAIMTIKSTILISGREIRLLMMFHRVTIGELSKRSGFTMKRIRTVRESGLSDVNAVRDWVQSISGRDPGNVNRWFAVERRMENVLKGLSR